MVGLHRSARTKVPANSSFPRKERLCPASRWTDQLHKEKTTMQIKAALGAWMAIWLTGLKS